MRLMNSLAAVIKSEGGGLLVEAVISDMNCTHLSVLRIRNRVAIHVYVGSLYCCKINFVIIIIYFDKQKEEPQIIT